MTCPRWLCHTVPRGGHAAASQEPEGVGLPAGEHRRGAGGALTGRLAGLMRTLLPLLLASVLVGVFAEFVRKAGYASPVPPGS